MANTFDVWLLGFERGTVDPTGALVGTFGLDPKSAAELEHTLPRAVKRDVVRSDADQYADALRNIGGRVEVRMARRSTPPPGLASLGPAPPQVVSAGAATLRSTPTPTPGRRPAYESGDVSVPEELRHQFVDSRAPYARITHSLPGLTLMAIGAVLLGAGLSLRANAFQGRGDLLDLLVAWVGATFLSAGVIEAGYGALRRRFIRARLPMALVWIAALAAIQYLNGSLAGPD